MIHVIKTAARQTGLVFTVLLATGAAQAQQPSVQFENISFEKAMSQARKTGKIIFVNVQGMNPSPADVQVTQDVLTQDSIARFFNDHCIAIKVNMNTEEGKAFAPRLAMLMYPVYAFYDRNGDQLDFINPVIALKEPASLMQKARSSLAMALIKMQNSRSIAFEKGSWEEILAKARKEHKLIFLDAYTAWCRPCIMMAKDIFTLNEVADFYNKHFINVSMDMEKGVGPALNKQYKVAAYPTYLFIDGSGKLVYRNGGYQEAAKFINAGQTALNSSAQSPG